MAKKKNSNNEFYNDETYIGIDGELGVLTDAQRRERAYQILNYTRGASKGKDSIITGKVIGVEANGDFVAALCEYEGFKITIVADEFMDFPEYDPKKYPYASEAKLKEVLLRSCIGAEIDFCALPKQKIGGKVVDTIDIENRFALCSRKHAMQKRYEQMWLKQKDGTRRITEGRAIAARVIRVSNTTVWFESNGVEFKISNKELSWSQIANARSKFRPGAREIVRILSIKYSDDEKNIKPEVTASLKQMKDDPKKRFCETMNEQEVYNGEVTSTFVSPKNGNTYFFVHCDNGADVMCGLSKTSLSRFPYRGDTVTIRIMRIVVDQARIFGMIIAIIEQEPGW